MFTIQISYETIGNLIYVALVFTPAVIYSLIKKLNS
jgi:hypothetical protein